MIRFLLVPLLLFCLGLRPAVGQTVAVPVPGQASGPTAAPRPAAVDARRALDVLKDDRRRAELIATLEAIVAAQGGVPATAPARTTNSRANGGASPATPAAVPPTETAPAEVAPAESGTPALALPLAPDSLGANLLLGLTDLANRAGTRLRESAVLTSGMPRLAGWAWTMATDLAWRALLLDVLWRAALAFIGGLVAMWLARRLLRRPRARLLARAQRMAAAAAADRVADAGLARAEEGETEAPATRLRDNKLWRRVPLVLGRLGLDLLAVLAFLLGVHMVVASPVGGTLLMQLVMLAPLHGFALWQAVLCLGAALTAPDAPALRLLPAGDTVAAYLQRQLRWLSGLVIIGDAIARVGWLLGMTVAAHAVFERTVLMVAHLGLAWIVLRQRAPMAAWLANAEARPGGFVPLRARLAPVWHWVALGGLAVLWVLLLLEEVGGPLQVLGFLLGSAGVLVLARLAGASAGRALDRLDAPPHGADSEEAATPTALHTWLRVFVRAAIGILTVLALFQVWGFSALAWLVSTTLGRQILGGLGTIGITVAIAVAVWELANMGIDRHIARLKTQARPGRAARLRTLLPMLRTTLFISILTMVGLTVLSQLGVNIAPLLAGAGVLGIAIGFGSQTLVRDVITGLFLLLENVMQVGDVVTLGGLTGVVEELSVRSIRLRAEDGSVHVIPFSAVTTVTNMTRDFGQAVIEARVAITEDYDRVVQLLRDAFEAMRAEPAWETDLIGDLDMMGLARMDDSAMVIKCRLRCGPFARWRVLREFQRRMQQSFSTNGVALSVGTPAAVAVR